MNEQFATLSLSDTAACIDGSRLGRVQRGCSVSAFSLYSPLVTPRDDMRIAFRHSSSPPFRFGFETVGPIVGGPSVGAAPNDCAAPKEEVRAAAFRAPDG